MASGVASEPRTASACDPGAKLSTRKIIMVDIKRVVKEEIERFII